MKKFYRRFLPVGLCLLILAGTVTAVSFWGGTEDGTVPEKREDSSAVSRSVSEPEPEVQEEMRGVWIPYMALTLGEEERSEQGFRNKMDKLLTLCVQNRLNTVIVQVRPFGDAIYPSRLFPWSHILTGTQGKALPFDPLAVIIALAHEKGLAVHAWINPFRISASETPPALAGDNPYYRLKSETLSCRSGRYYDPSSPAVRRLIIDGVRELLTGYDLEGIQIDDYFYPEQEEDCDKESYEAYVRSAEKTGVPLTRREWRRNNINMLVSGIWSSVHALSDKAVFGIAPQCNFNNNEEIGADVQTWSSQRGYADYLCPQLYVSRKHPVYPFSEIAKRWRETVVCPAVRLYFGLGLYKAGTDADSGTWLSGEDEIAAEIALSRELGAQGYLLYSSESLAEPEASAETE